MDSCTDPLHLNENNLFKHLKDGLPKSAKETRNILEIRDDVLYVWNADEFCVLTLNIAATCSKPGESIAYQVSTDRYLQSIENTLCLKALIIHNVCSTMPFTCTLFSLILTYLSTMFFFARHGRVRV